MIADLGGPGPACSALRVRRFVAGELSGVERERMQAHLEGCARCQDAVMPQCLRPLPGTPAMIYKAAELVKWDRHRFLDLDRGIDLSSVPH